MTRINNGLIWFLVVVITIFLQMSFIIVETTNTTNKTAISFSKAYFLLDSSMNKYLCNDLVIQNRANNYLEAVQSEASTLGFNFNSLRQSLSHIHIKTTYTSPNTATVRIKASSKTYINPLFAWTSTLFNLGRVNHIDKTLFLIKENKIWKISGSPFDLCK